MAIAVADAGRGTGPGTFIRVVRVTFVVVGGAQVYVGGDVGKGRKILIVANADTPLHVC